MEYFVIIGIIILGSILGSLISKKRIEQIIPINLVKTVLIIYIAGMFDHLEYGMYMVFVIAVIEFAIIVIMCVKSKQNMRENIKLILTPGLIIYIFMSALFAIINKDRILTNYDEYNHWAKIVKQMFMFNTYGSSENSQVTFNEYPPFTAIFQYMFLKVKNIYDEGVIITAQDILYLSLVMPVFKNVKWDKSLKKLLLVLPIMILLPMAYYEDFYLNILVDGIIGVMFALVLVSACEEDNKWRYINVFTYSIALCLTKTTGIALGFVALLIIFVRILINKIFSKKKIKNELLLWGIVVLLLIVLTSIWYIKVNGATKRWNFGGYLEKTKLNEMELTQVIKLFLGKVITVENITGANLTLLLLTIILTIANIFFIVANKNRNYTYYSIAFIITIPIYIVGILITYLSIFSIDEAMVIASYERYCSTILLAFTTFQVVYFISFNDMYKHKYTIKIALVIAIILMLPKQSIKEKYINSKEYIEYCKEAKTERTKLVRYKNMFNENDNILFITGLINKYETVGADNQYELMPIKVDYIDGKINSANDLEKILEAGEYTYLYIYDATYLSLQNLQELFDSGEIINDALYEINFASDGLHIKKVK